MLFNQKMDNVVTAVVIHVGWHLWVKILLSRSS